MAIFVLYISNRNIHKCVCAISMAKYGKPQQMCDVQYTRLLQTSPTMARSVVVALPLSMREAAGSNLSECTSCSSTDLAKLGLGCKWRFVSRPCARTLTGHCLSKLTWLVLGRDPAAHSHRVAISSQNISKLGREMRIGATGNTDGSSRQARRWLVV